ncbi:TetR family transcriptional regulator [Pseudonocardia acidicola]|uniref:TetR/AcrR family transcriptional regulator n=1 Tax=Pseudonocardia acidicola TaxID=2724939 RepID=A0ABX1S869_9PSEU|nr:TetR/AcrR family transcriptional regulator [Pseudonocardia acidicola]
MRVDADAGGDDTTPGVPAAERTPDRARVTRRALLIAAADQFYAAGYHGASLSEIVAAAGVTKGALYFHFPGKRVLAEAVIAEVKATFIAGVAEVTGRGLDPLDTLLVESDQAVARLLGDPIVRGGTRLLHDPLLRSLQTANLAGRQYGYAESVIVTQLTAAAQAGLLRPGLDATRRTQLAQWIVATIAGHHTICDLTGADAELWDRVTAMWQALLPMIAIDPWLDRWRRSDWCRRPRPLRTPT